MKGEKTTAKMAEKNGVNASNGEFPLSISPLGKRLRELSDRALDSGIATLSNKEIQTLISHVRGSHR